MLCKTVGLEPNVPFIEDHVDTTDKMARCKVLWLAQEKQETRKMVVPMISHEEKEEKEEKKCACYKAEGVLKSVSMSAVVVSPQTWRLSSDA